MGRSDRLSSGRRAHAERRLDVASRSFMRSTANDCYPPCLSNAAARRCFRAIHSGTSLKSYFHEIIVLQQLYRAQGGRRGGKAGHRGPQRHRMARCKGV